MRNRDSDRVIRACKEIIRQAERLKGKYVGTDEKGDTAITAYHPRRRKQKEILKCHNRGR